MKNELDAQIAEIQQRLGIIIPKVYTDFLREAHEMVFNDGILYGIDEIAERYQTLGFAEYAPDLLPIGNDNGDYALVMQSGSRITRFGFLEQGSVGSAKPSRMQNFRKWYDSGHSFTAEQAREQGLSANVQVILTKCPADKAKTILKIKNALHPDMPLSALLAAAEHPPVVLVNGITGAKAKKIIDENQLGEWLKIQF